MEEKIVILHGFSPEEAKNIMRAVKASVSEAAGAAFAMTTESNLHWKLGDLLEHVGEEHRAFLASRGAPGEST